MTLSTSDRLAFVPGPLGDLDMAALTISEMRVRTHIHGPGPCLPCLSDVAGLGLHAPALMRQLREQADRIGDLEAELATRPKPARAPRPVREPKPKRQRPCGTEAAYDRHRKAGEQPCAECVAFMGPVWAARAAGKTRHNGGSGAELADKLGRVPVEVP